MEIVSTIIESKNAYYIIVNNTRTKEQIGLTRYNLIKMIDHTNLGQWLDKPIRWTSYNPQSMELTIYI